MILGIALEDHWDMVKAAEKYKDKCNGSAITPLSEKSVELGFATINFPDFTGGAWMSRKPIFAFNDDF